MQAPKEPKRNTKIEKKKKKATIKDLMCPRTPKISQGSD